MGAISKKRETRKTFRAPFLKAATFGAYATSEKNSARVQVGRCSCQVQSEPLTSNQRCFCRWGPFSAQPCQPFHAGPLFPGTNKLHVNSFYIHLVLITLREEWRGVFLSVPKITQGQLESRFKVSNMALERHRWWLEELIRENTGQKQIVCVVQMDKSLMRGVWVNRW